MIGRSSMPTSAVKRITRKQGQAILRVPLSRLSLPLVLIFQGLISLVVLQNTAFQDEALYLLAGRQIIDGWLGAPHFPISWAYFLSGYAYFYPVIGGMLDILGGVELARLF